jgi:hypothetical protein
MMNKKREIGPVPTGSRENWKMETGNSSIDNRQPTIGNAEGSSIGNRPRPDGVSGQSTIDNASAARQVSLEAEQVARRLAGEAPAGFPTLMALGPAVLLAALAILIALWWLAHNAQLRREGELKEIQKQTTAEIAGLQAQADAAVRQANQTSSRAASQLEASRRLLEQQAQDLRQKLAALQQTEQARVEQIATLPTPEVWKRLEEQLGEGAVIKEESEVRSQESGEEKSESRNQKAEGADSEAGSQSKIQNLKSKIASPDTPLPTPDTLLLTETGARKVETALIELDSCRQQSSLQAQQLADCQREGAAEAAVVEAQKKSIAQLNQALADKDQILAKRQTEYQAEMKAARGTWRSRLAHVAEHVAVGVVIGLVLR